MRNPIIEWARYFFAFLVVCIHVPMKGYFLLFPIARCAVPFFYLVTGYFLFRNDTENQNVVIRRSIGKWGRLWVLYTIIFFIISLTLDVVMGQIGAWTIADTLKLLSTGTCPFVDQHTWHGKVYGILTTWFLYDGMLALALIYALRHWLHKGIILVVILIGQIVSLAVVRIGDVHLGLFAQSLPFLYYGYLVARHKQRLFALFGSLGAVRNILICLAVYAVSVVEWNVIKNDIPFATIPLSLLGFSLLMTFSAYMEKGLINISLPPHVHSIYTLDIYLWHRLVFYGLSVLDFQFYKFSALIVFLITLLIAVMFRYVIDKKTCNA